MQILSHKDAVRAHAAVAELVVGQTTRYNNKRVDHRMIKWVVPYPFRLKRARAALTRAKIGFHTHLNYAGEATGISIRVPLDFVAPVDPHAAVKVIKANTFADALALVLDMASKRPGERTEVEAKALALVAAHLKKNR